MGAALVGLLGAFMGVAGTLFVASRTRKAAEELADKERRAKRLREEVELAADGFTLALTAVSWMGSMTVEDSVNPRFADRYGPRSSEAENAAREAISKLNKVAALQGENVLGLSAGTVATQVGSLLYAWENTRDARRRLDAAPKRTAHDESWFMSNFNRINEVRMLLTGVDDHDLDPLHPGSAILPSSSLGSLRSAVSVAGE